MSYSYEQIEYLHDTGLMPDRYYYQQNGKSAMENFRLQRMKINSINAARIQARLLQEKLDEAYFIAMQQSLEQEAETISDEIANNTADMIEALFNGGTINPGALHDYKFAAQLGAMVGRAIGQAPEKIIMSFLEDEEDTRKKR